MNRENIARLFVSIAVFAAAMPLVADTALVNGIEWEYTVNYNDRTATLDSISSATTGSLSIPSTINSYRVTGIGDSAFSYCRGLTKATIPDSVTRIGENAFEGCSGLVSIKIGNGVTNIGVYAFGDCTNLTSVVIPDSVMVIGESVFSGCSSLASVKIGNGVVDIGNYAFCDCANLTSVAIPDSVTDIGEYAFSDCSSLASVKIGNGVTSIREGAFSGCSSLASVKIGNGLTSLGYDVFSGCSDSLYDTTTIFGVVLVDGWAIANTGDVSGDLDLTGVRGIGPCAFEYCSLLESVKIEKGVVSIGDYAFCGCDSLASVVIPDGVIRIGEGAFSGCSGLMSVTMPDSVMSIGGYAFEYCSGLASVKIGNGVTNIGVYAFGDCTNLTSVVIPDSVMVIGESVFSGCSSLASVKIGNGLTSLGGNVFFDCSDSLYDTDTVPGVMLVDGWVVDYTGDVSGGLDLTGVRGIGNEAFWGYDRLTDVTIPDGVTSIGRSVFHSCNNLTNVTLSGSVTRIEENAFRGCSSLTNMIIPDSVTSIGEGAFSRCSGLTSITLPFVGSRRGNSGSPDSLLGYIFGTDSYDGGRETLQYYNNPNQNYYDSETYCIPSALESVVITDETVLGDGAFYGCSGLSNVTIPNSVTNIAKSVFCGCSGLTSITLPFVGLNRRSLDHFGIIFGSESYAGGTKVRWASYSYYYIPSALKSVEITDDTSWNGAFSNCSGLTNVTIPDNMMSISRNAFEGCTSLFDTTTIPGVKLVDGWAIGTEGWLSDYLDLSGVRGIGDSAFEDCSGLTSVELSEGLRVIGRRAFARCTSLRTINIPDSVVNMGYGAFARCPAVFDENGFFIYKNVLYDYCGNAKTVVIPDGVKEIASSMLNSCDSEFITKIKIPDSVERIAAETFEYEFLDHYFYGDPYMDTRTIPGAILVDGWVVGWYKNRNTRAIDLTKARGIADDGLSGAFTDGDGVRLCEGNVIIPGHIKIVPVAAFECASLASVSIAEGVRSIEEGAFSETDLRAITIPSTVTNVGEYAFAGCKDLESARIPSTLNGKIPDSAFKGCGSQFTITYYDVVGFPQYVGVSVASDCVGMGSVTGGNNVFAVDAKVSIKATAKAGFVFAGWYNGETLLSRSAAYTYVVTDKEVELVARFATAEDDAASIAIGTDVGYATADDGSFTLNLQELTASLSEPKLAVSGLPTGLKLDTKTGVIGGTATKPGVYKVTVSATNKTVKKPVTATFELVVPNLASEKLPGLKQETDAYGIVTSGVAFDPGLVDCSPEDGWTVKAAGLPTGLKFVQNKATGAYSITGVPTKAGTFTVTFTASKKGEKNQVATITLVTKALPEWAVGTFSGFVEHSAGPESGSDFGSITMTVAANGKVSGKIALVGTNYTFSAASYARVTDDGCFVVDAEAKAGKVVRPLRLLVLSCCAPESSPSLLNARAVGSLDSPLASEILMCRGMWKDKATAAVAKTEIAKWKGVYTLSMADGGYLSLTVGKDGNVKASGKLADGTSVNATTPLLHDGETGFLACVYSAPSAYKGGALAMSIGFNEGEGGIRTLGDSREIAQWASRNPQATGEYGAGFNRAVEFAGAYYNKLETLRKYYESLRVSFDSMPLLAYTFKETNLDGNGKKATTSSAATEEAVNTLWQDGLSVAVSEKGAIVVEKATKPVQDKPTNKWIYNGTNDGALTLSFAQATGIFKGSYTFWYDYESAHDYTTGKSTMAHTSKKVNFEGIMVQGANEMCGFYLWDASSVYDDPKTGKEKTYKYKESYPVYLVCP